MRLFVIFLMLAAFADVTSRAAEQPVASETGNISTIEGWPVPVRPFIQKHCLDCHSGSEPAGNLNLTTLAAQFEDTEIFRKWVKIFDRINTGEMPPAEEPRPKPEALAEVTGWLHQALLQAEQQRLRGGRTGLRRLTRAEYENTVRDLLDLPGIQLQDELPADGSAHGFDKNSDALDISHVTLARYVAAAEKALDMAIATRPEAPPVVQMRTSLAFPAGFVAHVLLHGDGVLLKDKKPDPDFPPAGEQLHVDQGAHERMGAFARGSSVGLFRHEDESFHPYFNEFVAIYPGRHRIRTSLWSFQWDCDQVLPARGTEAVRLSIVTLTGDGRGGGHPSRLLTYLDAPSLQEQIHELDIWLNVRDTLGYNAASLAPGAITRGPKRALGFTGPGIACDWLEYEGPIFDQWPPTSHRRLFNELPLCEFKPEAQPQINPPPRSERLQAYFPGRNPPTPNKAVWTVHSDEPLADAERLLADFLPRAYRRPVPAALRQQYVAKVAERLQAGDCFESAMRWVYRAILCSPHFLFHVEPVDRLDDFALASRLSYFLWNSLPDEHLMNLAATGPLAKPEMLTPGSGTAAQRFQIRTLY